MKFEEFPKMARLSRECIITEKIDGTNAQICITDEFEEAIMKSQQDPHLIAADEQIIVKIHGKTIRAGSRNKWITPGKQTDNMGFAGWVRDNAQELVKLGEGRHFGEWWGKGIGRGYRVPDKRFSLFNAKRWTDNPDLPSCCRIVPILWRGIFDTDEVEDQIRLLREGGSKAAPGFMDPEGIVIYHLAGGVGFKKTIKNDESPKSLI